MIRRPRRSPLFPSTPLSRSLQGGAADLGTAAPRRRGGGRGQRGRQQGARGRREQPVQHLHHLFLVAERAARAEPTVSVGAALLPLYSAWNPNVVLDPGAIWALNEALSAVTAAPDCVTAAFQKLVIFWLPAQLQATCHEAVGAVPLFATVPLAGEPVAPSLSTRDLAPNGP